MADGELLWGSVREVARVAVPETDAEWVEVARGKSGRAVQQMVSGLVPGDRPGAPRKAEAEDAVLRFEVKASTKALFAEAQRKLQRDGGRSLDDDELLLEMARAVLEGPKKAGRASYQVQMTVCEECGAGWQQAGGEQVPVEPAAVATAMCDVQVVPSLERPTGPDAKPPTGPDAKPPTGPDAKRPAGPDAKPPTGPDAKRPPGPEVARPLAVGRKRSGERVTRATQPVPKRVRELVIRRDEGRCSVPGCANRTWLDVHHTEPTSDGGTNEPDLLCTLCGAHHKATHEGRLLISGRHPSGFRFRYADGSDATGLLESPTMAAKLQTVRQLLRSLGFKLAEANDAVDRVLPDAAPEMAVEDLVRAALRTLA